MLNNHLTFIQSVYKKCLFILLLSLMACASGPSVKKKDSQHTTRNFDNESCDSPEGPAEIKYLTTAAQASASKLIAHCFAHYIKFETDKNQTLQVCNTLTVKKKGNISFVHLRGFRGDRLPKDVKMCMTQEYLKMDFSKMQLDSGYTIRFPIKFATK